MQHQQQVNRFAALDGIRGIAALAVVLFHYSDFHGQHWLPRAWLAVDVFVCLSGFVIAHTYQQKISEGMSFRAFALRRLSRLYPLYVFGLLLGVCTFLAGGQSGWSAADMGKALGLGLLVLPYFNALPVSEGAGNVVGALFPFNGPSWSMFFELFINMVFFGLLFFRVRRLWWVVGVSAVLYVLAAYATHGGLNAGWRSSTIWVGFPRVAYAFFIGVALYRRHDFQKMLHSSYGVLCIFLMLIIFASPESKLVSIAGVFLLGPLMVCSNAGARPGPRLVAVYGFLGGISYPLYIIHVPLFRGLSMLKPSSGWSAPAWVQIVGSTVLAVVAAWWVAMLDTRWRRHRAGLKLRSQLPVSDVP